MPELPEVETIRRDIDREFVNKRIKKVEVTIATDPSVATTTAKDFVVRVEGRKLARHPAAGEVPPVASSTAATCWSPIWA